MRLTTSSADNIGGSRTGDPPAPKGKAVVERFVAIGGRLPVLLEAEVCEGTGHKNAQPTNPEWDAQAADLHRSKCIIATTRNSVAVTVI
jgi:hypothetical protein